jgi:predicted nicotinamide N-methyase
MDRLKEAYAHLGAGRLDEAAAAAKDALGGDPENAEAGHLLGFVYFRLGRTAEARDIMQRAVASPAATPEMQNNFGGILNAIGDPVAARTAFERALALRPDYADALNNLGVVLRDAKRIEEAVAALRRAIAVDPGHAQAKSNLRAAYRDVVPAWHFAMMDDTARNAAFEAAIGRAAPGKRVLDIGTGAGLLAMMAARAGATEVTSCETVALIAERARNIVARNGLAQRVTVIAKPSTELEPGRDMASRAELLVTETFASNLIGEGILPAVEDAHERLLAPGAAVIPAAASVMGYLAGGETLRGMLFVERVRGFDLAPFNDFAPPSLSLLLDHVPHNVLSGDTELLRFDFGERRFPMASGRVTLTATGAGVALGIAQWIRLELDSENRYANRPAPDSAFNGHWTHVLYRFPRPVPVKPGDAVTVSVRHDRTQVTVDLAE